jgi:hypothetical protein
MILRSLPVKMLELTEALDQPRGGPVRTFVDRQTGEVEHVPRDAEVEGVFDDIFASPQRWIEVQPVPRQLRQELRARFVDQETDGQLRLRLLDALATDRPLARFAQVVREVPGALDGWLAYRDRELVVLAGAWLSALGVAPQAATPEPPLTGG